MKVFTTCVVAYVPQFVCYFSVVHSDWITMKSSCHDALGQPPYSQTSNPSHSVLTMAACRKDLWPYTVSILSIFLTTVLSWKSVEKYRKYFIVFVKRFCHYGNPWDRSQVFCRRWWAISRIPRSCVHPRSLPGRLCPRLRSFFPLQELSEPQSL